jgi:bis(5'-adenosyl)-triphosphatase
MAYDPFCGKEMRDEVFLETEHFFAVPNLHPILPGHVLVVPKRHVKGITELGSAEVADLKRILDLLLPRLLEANGTDSYNLSINNGIAAGMSIPHMHVHVVPRHRTDAFQKEGIKAFYTSLENETPQASGNFEAEVAALRKLFKYESGER